MFASHRPAMWSKVGIAALTLTTVAAACGSSTHSAQSATSSSSTPSTSPAGGTTGGISGTGVTASEIKIGQIVTASGPVPGLFEGAAQGLDAYVAYINSQGGVAGRKLVVVHEDDAYDCTTYKSKLQSLSSQVFAVVGNFTLEDNCGASILQANPSLPDIQAYILNPQLFSLPNAYAASTQPPGFQTTGYQWVKDKYPQDITHTGSIYLNTAAAEFQEQSSAAESIGYKYVYKEGIQPTDTNFTAEILRMKSDGIKIVDLTSQGTAQGAATFLTEAAQQGFHPDAVIDFNAYDAKFFTYLGSAASTAANNLILPNYFDMYLGDGAGNPELATYLQWLHQVHPGAASTDYGVTAWAAGMLFANAVRAAQPNVTQQAVVQAVTNLGSFTANGLLPPDNPGKHVGPTCEIIVGVANGSFVRLDPATTGFECNGTYHSVSAG